MTAFSWADVRGCPEVVEDVKAAVAQRKSVLLSGPPGILSTMIARRIPLLRHKLSMDQAASLRTLYNRYNLDAEWKEGDIPPFRAPHHSVGAAAMWSTKYRTGEVGMAMFGVLFLGEIGEFATSVLRHTAEHVETAKLTGHHPLIVASALPCPCGWMKSDLHKCKCTNAIILRHRAMVTNRCDDLSIDTIINVPSVSLQDMRDAAQAENNPPIQA